MLKGLQSCPGSLGPEAFISGTLGWCVDDWDKERERIAEGQRYSDRQRERGRDQRHRDLLRDASHVGLRVEGGDTGSGSQPTQPLGFISDVGC